MVITVIKFFVINIIINIILKIIIITLFYVDIIQCDKIKRQKNQLMETTDSVEQSY